MNNGRAHHKGLGQEGRRKQGKVFMTNKDRAKIRNPDDSMDKLFTGKKQKRIRYQPYCK